MKLDLHDVTFIIPVRLDSIIRIENLMCVIRYLKKHFNSNIIVLESSAYNNGILEKILPNNVRYIFIEDDDPIFFRTYYLNQMTDMVETPILGIWDADVIVPVCQIVDSVENLRYKDKDVAYPYNSDFLDTSVVLRNIFIQKGDDISIFATNRNKMQSLYTSNGGMKGGAILVNKNKYIESGKENENFYGWGSEDFERYARWKALRYKIYRSDGCIYHLSHPRDINGTYNSQLQFRNMRNELNKITNCSSEEIHGLLKKAHESLD